MKIYMTNFPISALLRCVISLIAVMVIIFGVACKSNEIGEIGEFGAMGSEAGSHEDPEVDSSLRKIILLQVSDTEIEWYPIAQQKGFGHRIRLQGGDAKTNKVVVRYGGEIVRMFENMFSGSVLPPRALYNGRHDEIVFTTYTTMPDNRAAGLGAGEMNIFIVKEGEVKLLDSIEIDFILQDDQGLAWMFPSICVLDTGDLLVTVSDLKSTDDQSDFSVLESSLIRHYEKTGNQWRRKRRRKGVRNG